MAVLYVSEYASTAIPQVGGMQMQVPMEPPLVDQTVAIGGTSTQSAAFNAKTTLVRIETDAICAILFGTNPTAVVAGAGAGSQRLAAGGVQFHAVPKGQSFKVAVISTT